MTFIVTNAIVSFLSDLTLNLLSRSPHAPSTIRSLAPYFRDKHPIIAGVYASLTIVCALLITSVFSRFFMGFSYPRTEHELPKFLVLCFLIGFIIDVYIERLDIFGPTLHPYYKKAGSGFWGGAAFVFSVGISFMIQTYKV